jgi:hypothetical protein
MVMDCLSRPRGTADRGALLQLAKPIRRQGIGTE